MYRKLLLVAKTLPSLSILAFGSFVVVAPLTAQTHAPIEPRVTQAVDSAQLVTLRGNTHPLAQARFDAGAAPASLPAGRLLLILKRSDKQEADLQQFLASVQDPKSANYRKFLTPEQFGQSYGVADPDIAAVSSWLRGQGFLVTKVNKARTVVEFSGNAGQVQNAFRTSIRSYVVNGEHHYANASDPKIPAALAPVVAGITGLNDFRPRPYGINGPVGRYDLKSRQFKPQLTAGTSPNFFLYVAPADAATIYNAPTPMNHNFANSGGSTVFDGTGVTIGIVGDSNINTVDTDNYRAMFGLPAKPTNVIIDGQDPGINADSDEALLDTQIAGGLAPGASVNLYISANTTLQSGVFLAMLRAVDDNAVDILNVSFGNCEANLGDGNQTIENLYQQAAAQGITVTVATGDSGSADCDDSSTEGSAIHGLAVNGFASTPYNIAVGGTDFDLLTDNFSTYVDTNQGTANPPPYFGSVIAPIDPSTGTVIPENPWNNSTFPNLGIAANVPFLDTNSTSNIFAAGGGASNCSSVNTDPITGAVTSCIGGYTKPDWQLAFQDGLGLTHDFVRDLPDVSLFASNGFYSAAWAVCRDNDCILDSAGHISSATTVHGFGGTSTSSPAFAGILAIVSQEEGLRTGVGPIARLGQANTVLYPLALNHPAVFHDVTSGNISVPCTTGTPDCGTNGFLTGFEAATSFDSATGLGSVDITALETYWNTAVAGHATTTTLTLNASAGPITVTHGATVTLDATVLGTPGTPTGDVAIVTNLDPKVLPNYGGIGLLTLTGGTATGTTNVFPGGTYQVYARYSGDATFTSSTSTPPVTLTVNPENSVSTLNVAVNGVAVVPGNSYPYGSIIAAFIQPTGLAGPDGLATGTATYSDNGTAVLTTGLNSNGVAEYDNNGLAVGPHSLQAAYSGDASFRASSSAAIAFNITKTGTISALASSDSQILPGQSVSFSVELTTPSHGASPGGTVDFFLGATKLTTATVTPSFAGTLQTTATSFANATIAGGALAPGANAITAVYNGDANYTGSTSAPVTVTVSAPATTTTVVTPSATSIGAADSVTLTVAISTPLINGPAPTGMVSFKLAGAPLGSPVPVNGTDGTVSTAASGTATLVIQGSLLAGGANSITAIYSGDPDYTGSTSVAITVNIQQSFSMTASQPANNISAGSSAVSTLTLTPSGGLTGDITFTCTAAGTKAGDVHIPTCSAPKVTIATGSANVTATVTVNTTAATTAALHLPASPNPGSRWLPLAGGTVLACVVFFGIPARRRSWRAMLGMVVFLAALTVSGCGGGGGGNGGGGGGNTQPGTSADTYTITVTGTANLSTGAITKTATFKVTVN